MTMLEKMARAAYFSYGFTSPWESDPERPFGSAQHDTKEKFRAIVRAALLAIREPDEGTLIASGMLDPESRELARSMWTAMIDHVLESGG